ncbi:hypothetical protein CRENBAI_011979 [Crenichthys baileyi]|uniref:Uncharacterized protein n=1 Tax=Crenichthys baileyi TaxID=28760 RepID=A0AAV9R8P7_9TELE
MLRPQEVDRRSSAEDALLFWPGGGVARRRSGAVLVRHQTSCVQMQEVHFGQTSAIGGDIASGAHAGAAGP